MQKKESGLITPTEASERLFEAWGPRSGEEGIEYIIKMFQEEFQGNPRGGHTILALICIYQSGEKQHLPTILQQIHKDYPRK
jgi:hypothetical protein